MPLPSPAGPLITLEELVAEARRDGGGALSERFTSPVMLVVAPAEGWANVTALKTGDRQLSVTMMPTIVVRVEGRASAPAPEKLHLGRSSVCEVILPFSALSKVHGYLSKAGEEWLFEDAGSRNGSVVNGAKLLAGQKVALKDGAVLRFGDVTAKFLLAPSFLADVRRRIG